MDKTLNQLWETLEDREAWCTAVHGVTKSRTRLSDWTTYPSRLPVGFYFCFIVWLLCAKNSAMDFWLFSISLAIQFSSSVQSVMSDSLWPYELQQARPPCLSPTPGVDPNSCMLSRWCHPTISSFVAPFSSRLQSFPASGSFQMSHNFTAGGKNIGVSASTSVLPMNTQDWFPLGWTGWISLQPKGLSSLLQHHSSKTSVIRAQLSL